MTSIWSWLQDISVAGKYSLLEVLGESEDGAFFRTSFGPEGQTAALKLISESSHAASEEQLRLWRIAAQISHPNLLRLLDYGRTEIEGNAFLYAVFEFPDDSLATAIDRGPLSPEETRDVLVAALDGLRHIHSQGLVHGAIDPRHVVAVGNQIKLSTDTLRLPSRDATTTEDIRALGALVHQLITGRRPLAVVTGPDLLSIPEPFRTVCQHCLAHDPNQRWSLAEAAAALNSPPPLTVTPAKPAKQTPAVTPRPFPKWIFVATPLFLLVLILLFRAIKPKPETPALPPALVAQAPVAPKAAPSRNWRVIAYTYSRRAEAEKRAQSINRKWSAAQAEVLGPAGAKRGAYLVALGGPMNRDEAQRFLKLARSRGMPRTTYLRSDTP
jgi:serine/threonine protein kinase